MNSTLETLIKLAEFQVDERRRELKEIQEKEDRLIAAQKTLAERVESEKKAAQESLEAGFAYGQFLSWAKLERQRLQKEIEIMQPELEQARFNLSESFAEQKKVEITKERQDKKAQEELKAKDQAFIDEFTTNQHIRKKSK